MKLTAQQVAKRTGAHTSQVHQWGKAGKLTVTRGLNPKTGREIGFFNAGEVNNLITLRKAGKTIPVLATGVVTTFKKKRRKNKKVVKVLATPVVQATAPVRFLDLISSLQKRIGTSGTVTITKTGWDLL